MKTELWNGHSIRFVEVSNEWAAVAKDISDALDYADATRMVKRIPPKYIWTTKLEVQGQGRKSLALTEFGIYKAIFGSHKPEAEQFQEWVFNIIKQLRQSTGLEGFEVFRMMDKQHQKDAMKRLRDGLKRPVRVNFIKANTVANNAVSTKYGYPKMVKKGEMTPAMLVDREAVLDDTVQLMQVNDQYKLGISVSKAIYKNLAKTQPA